MSDIEPDTTPRERSQAQTEASRNNGARGKGPVTDAGKAASCQNATKHGLRATFFALLPDEDADAFEALRARLVEEHDPRGAVEEALVEGLALALWRTRRVEALEVEALTSARERRPSPVYAGGYNPYSPFSWSPERLNTILRYRAQLERALHRALKALAERRAARATEANDTNQPGAPVRDAAPNDAAAQTPPITNKPHERTRAGAFLARLGRVAALLKPAAGKKQNREEMARGASHPSASAREAFSPPPWRSLARPPRL